MGNVSRPLIALLAATVAFLALWLVALKPGSGGGGSSSTPAAVVSTPHTSVAHTSVATTPATAPATAHKSATSPKHHAASAHARAAHTAKHAGATHVRHAARAVHQPPAPATASARFHAAQEALQAGKVLALLFYNPAAPDDNAVKAELATIPTHNGQVVKLAVPLNELPSYSVVTAQVPVNFSPTLVIIDRHRQASTITGFADTLEIAQRISNAL